MGNCSEACVIEEVYETSRLDSNNSSMIMHDIMYKTRDEGSRALKATLITHTPKYFFFVQDDLYYSMTEMSFEKGAYFVKILDRKTRQIIKKVSLHFFFFDFWENVIRLEQTKKRYSTIKLLVTDNKAQYIVNSRFIRVFCLTTQSQTSRTYETGRQVKCKMLPFGLIKIQTLLYDLRDKEHVYDEIVMKDCTRKVLLRGVRLKTTEAKNERLHLSLKTFLKAHSKLYKGRSRLKRVAQKFEIHVDYYKIYFIESQLRLREPNRTHILWESIQLQRPTTNSSQNPEPVRMVLKGMTRLKNSSKTLKHYVINKIQFFLDERKNRLYYYILCKHNPYYGELVAGYNSEGMGLTKLVKEEKISIVYLELISVGSKNQEFVYKKKDYLVKGKGKIRDYWFVADFHVIVFKRFVYYYYYVDPKSKDIFFLYSCKNECDRVWVDWDELIVWIEQFDSKKMDFERRTFPFGDFV